MKFRNKGTGTILEPMSKDVEEQLIKNDLFEKYEPPATAGKEPEGKKEPPEGGTPAAAGKEAGKTSGKGKQTGK